MDFLKAIFGGGLLLFGLFVIFCSYSRQIQNFRNRGRANTPWSSPAPFIGPIFVLVGLTMMSVDLPAWSLLLFVADPDTVIVVVSLPALLVKLRQKS
jgi:hypothetical protein